MSRPGERFHDLDEHAKTVRAREAHAQVARRDWEARQALLVRDQQQTLREAFYRRHPELVCGHDRQSGHLALRDDTMTATVECDDCGTRVRTLDEFPYRPDPKLGEQAWAA